MDLNMDAACHQEMLIVWSWRSLSCAPRGNGLNGPTHFLGFVTLGGICDCESQGFIVVWMKQK